MQLTKTKTLGLGLLLAAAVSACSADDGEISTGSDMDPDTPEAAGDGDEDVAGTGGATADPNPGTGSTAPTGAGGTTPTGTGGSTQPTSSGTLCAGEFPANIGTFVADADGIIVMEMESHSPEGWTLASEFSGYAGGGYYYNSGGAGSVTFTFHIDTQGTYRMNLRNYIDDPNITEANDVFTQIDGRPEFKTFSHGDGNAYQWTWDTGLDAEGKNMDPAVYVQPTDYGGGHLFVKPPGYILGPGDHTLTIQGRSTGFSVDRIHIYPEGVPESTALDASRPSSGQVDCQ